MSVIIWIWRWLPIALSIAHALHSWSSKRQSCETCVPPLRRLESQRYNSKANRPGRAKPAVNRPGPCDPAQRSGREWPVRGRLRPSRSAGQGPVSSARLVFWRSDCGNEKMRRLWPLYAGIFFLLGVLLLTDNSLAAPYRPQLTEALLFRDDFDNASKVSSAENVSFPDDYYASAWAGNDRSQSAKTPST